MQNLIQFPSFNGQQLRHVMIEGEPWFVAADVCLCLGIGISSGTSVTLAPLAGDERRRFYRLELPMNFLGRGVPSANFVSESGLYKLILRAQSSRPEVSKFQDWVTKDVLPSIRKTGGYLLHASW